MDEIINNYVSKVNWEVKENANTSYSFPGLQLHIAETAIKNYMLNTHYKGKIASSHKDGAIYIHDLGFGNIVYCMGHDLKELLERGLNGVHGKINTSAPKHLRSAVNQMINYLFSAQGNCAGAQAFNNVDTLLAPYVKSEELSYKEIKQCMQELIYHLNIPTRVGMQSPFTNMTFDLKCPEHFKNMRPIISGKKQDFTYGDCNKEIGNITKAFFEIMIEGDSTGQPFTFPIPTINLHKDFVWDDEVAKAIFEATAKFGIPNFQNFINSDLNPEDTFSMCCRLRLDKRELLKNSGGLFGSSSKTGSIGVVTINMPRIGYEIKQQLQTKNIDDESLELCLKEAKKKLDNVMGIAKDSLEIKRRLINENLEKGLMPYVKSYIGTFNNHFSTIGIVGGQEFLKNISPKLSLENKSGKKFMSQILQYMRDKISGYQEETGNLYNLEQSPAESTSYKLAQLDKSKYSDIYTAGTDETPYYTNSTHLPVDNSTELFDMLETQDELNKFYNGGTTVHIFLGQRVSDWINAMLFVRKVAEKTTLPFFTLTPTFSICPIHGYISGSHEFCPLEHSEEDMKKYGIYVQEEKNNEQI